MSISRPALALILINMGLSIILVVLWNLSLIYLLLQTLVYILMLKVDVKGGAKLLTLLPPSMLVALIAIFNMSLNFIERFLATLVVTSSLLSPPILELGPLPPDWSRRVSALIASIFLVEITILSLGIPAISTATPFSWALLIVLVSVLAVLYLSFSQS